MLDNKRTLNRVKTLVGADADKDCKGTYFVDGTVKVKDVCTKSFPNSYMLDSGKTYQVEKIVFTTNTSFQIFALTQKANAGSVIIPVENIEKLKVETW